MSIGKGIATAGFTACAVWSAVSFQNEDMLYLLTIPALAIMFD